MQTFGVGSGLTQGPRWPVSCEFRLRMPKNKNEKEDDNEEKKPRQKAGDGGKGETDRMHRMDRMDTEMGEG